LLQSAACEATKIKITVTFLYISLKTNIDLKLDYMVNGLFHIAAIGWISYKYTKLVNETINMKI